MYIDVYCSVLYKATMMSSDGRRFKRKADKEKKTFIKLIPHNEAKVWAPPQAALSNSTPGEFSH